MKEDIKNIAASVRDRLKNTAKMSSRPFGEVLQYYGMERFLYRFSQSSHKDKFILKGALMFAVWDVPDRRTTLDIDFLARYDNRVESFEKIMKDVCQISVSDDALIFDPQTVTGQKIKEDADYEGVRIKFVGFLERSRIPMQIDIGFGDVVYPKPKSIDYPVMLDFPKPNLKGYPVESVVSEKFEAMIKLGLLNSRMKDFYDTWLLTRQFPFGGLKITESLKRTFTHRKTDLPMKKPLFAPEIYDKNSDRQTLWQAFLKKGEIKHAPKTLSSTAKIIEKFLVTPLESIVKREKFLAKWNVSGKWEIDTK